MSPRLRGWNAELPPPHIWLTLGYRGLEHGDGRSVIEWDATPDFCFHAESGPIVHGGMVATLLDTAMGSACWSLLEEGESFLTADLRVEFMRSARPGALRAEGLVVQRNRRVAFCSADLYDGEGTLLASSRCTQIIRRDQKQGQTPEGSDPKQRWATRRRVRPRRGLTPNSAGQPEAGSDPGGV